ncbi:hypothetical protein [Myceligenerans cantabricum]
MTTLARPFTSRVLALLAAVLALAVLVHCAPQASAQTVVGPQDVVGLHASNFQASVGLPERVSAGHGRVPTTAHGRIVVATGVAPSMDSFLPAGGDGSAHLR